MDRETRKYVRDRAGDHCEYCLLLQNLSPVARLQIEHIIVGLRYKTGQNDLKTFSPVPGHTSE